MSELSITVVGTGYLGLTAALALAKTGLNVACVGPVNWSGTGPPSTDTRSTALFPASVTLLEDLGVWAACAHTVRPLAGIRIVDDTGRLFRSPEILFRAADVGLDALAINIPNGILHEALVTAVRNHPAIDTTVGGHVSAITHGPGHAVIETDTGQSHETNIVVAADGRRSVARNAAGINTRTWSYNQTAIALSITHDAPHDDISTEFHRCAGPFTTVPGPTTDAGHTSHLVWIETPEEAARVHELRDSDISALIEDRLQGLLGQVTAVGKRQLFPLEGRTASVFASRNTFLVGEAAHVMPPIGAQGMNLGMRDVIGLVASLGQYPDSADRANAEHAYNENRRQDVWMRTTAVDLLNRMLITPFWPLQGMRGAGLHLLNAIPPLKRATIRAGFGR